MLWVRVLPGLRLLPEEVFMDAHKKKENKIAGFVKESYAELRKVVWPSREDVIGSVKVVVVSTVIIAAVLGLIDVLLLLGVQALF
jgi:preprotein translocase subunit SecE